MTTETTTEVAMDVAQSKYVTMDMNDITMCSLIAMVGVFALIFLLSAIRGLIEWLWIKYPLVDGVITNISAQLAFDLDDGFKSIKIDVEYDFNGEKRTGTINEKIKCKLSDIPKYQVGDTMKLYRNPVTGKLRSKEYITVKTPGLSNVIMMSSFTVYFISIFVKLIQWKKELDLNIQDEIKVLTTTAETNIKLYMGGFLGSILLAIIVGAVIDYIEEAKIKKQLRTCDFVPVRAIVTAYDKVWVNGGKNSHGYFKYYECYRYEYRGRNYIYTSKDYKRSYNINQTGTEVELNYNINNGDIIETEGSVFSLLIKVAEIIFVGMFIAFFYFIISNISL